MARKAAAKTTSPKTKTTATRTRTAKKSGQKTFPQEDQQRAAYFNWLDRGAPLWDDQRDWFSAT